MKRNAGLRFVGILSGVVILLCSISFAWAEGEALVWEKVSHLVSNEESLSSIAAKANMTPTALMVFNDLKRSYLRPNTTIFIADIKQVMPLHGERILGNPNVISYQIYSADRKCYAMVYAVAKNDGDYEQFLAVFAFEGKAWVETDRIAFNHPVKLNFKHHLKLLPSDEFGNEGCSFFLKRFSCDCKGYDVDGIIHAPAISQQLHGIRLMQRNIKTVKKKDVEATSYDMYAKYIGSAWPDRLSDLKEKIFQNQSRLLRGYLWGKQFIYWE